MHWLEELEQLRKEQNPSKYPSPLYAPAPVPLEPLPEDDLQEDPRVIIIDI